MLTVGAHLRQSMQLAGQTHRNCLRNRMRARIVPQFELARSIWSPHPVPLPEGEGTIWSRFVSPLALWERNRVRVVRVTIAAAIEF